MEDKELWVSISGSVRSGEETRCLDLKCSFHKFADETDKGEFIKDVCGIANGLLEQGTEGYLVYGVRDASDCPDRTNPAEYVSGVPFTSRDAVELCVNQILGSNVDPPLALKYRLLTPALTGMPKDIAVLVIRAWTENHEFCPLPYVVKRSVGKLRPGVVMIRRESMSVPASRDEIVNLAARLIRLKYEEKMRTMETHHQEKTQSLHMEHEEKLRDLGADFQKRMDVEVETEEELRHSIKWLRAEVERLSAEARDWRHIAYEGLYDLYYRVAEDRREEKLKRILAQGRRQASFSDIIREITRPE